MIGTITINPSIDQHMAIDKLVKDDAVRVHEISRYPGGKGINVSRVIKELGGETTAFSVAGGCAGYMLKSLISDQGFPFEIIDVLEETRINVIITDKSDRTQTRLHADGPFASLDVTDRLFSRVSGYEPMPEWWVLGGSLPPGAPTDFYARFIQFFKDAGVKCFLDADNDALKLGIEAKPYFIKPNEYEMSRLAGRALPDEASIIDAAYEIISGGVEVVAVTRGPKGALVITKESVLRAKSPDIETKSKVGAGDSFLAGCVLALSRGQAMEESIRLGMAAGTAAVMHEGTSLCRREDVEKIINQIVIENVEHKNQQLVRSSIHKKLDVVCGMQVDPSLAPFEASYEGEEFRFCSLKCHEKFNKNPKTYTSIKNLHKTP